MNVMMRWGWCMINISTSSLIRVVGHARGRDLTGLKNYKKIDFVNFMLMATENCWFNCNEIYNQ